MSLDTTYRTLTQSAHPQVTEVLRHGIAHGDASTRRRCFAALAMRQCRRSHEHLIALWAQHSDEICQSLGDQTQRFGETVNELLAELLLGKHAEQDAQASEEQTQLLGNIAAALSIRAAMPTLIAAAWQHPSHIVRQACANTVLSLSHTWSRQARQQYAGLRPDPAGERLRLQLTSQLHACTENFQQHRNQDLLDAFLILSSWNDPALHRALREPSASRRLILRRLRNSHQQPVLELLAGFICKRNIPDCLLPLLLQRDDAMYCEILLQKISMAPTPTTLANLKEYGLPDCLRGGVSLLRTLGPDRDAAMAHAYSAAMQQAPETIVVLLEIIERHRHATQDNAAVHDAVAISLARCRIPSFEFWCRAFESDVLDGAPSSGSLADDTAEICVGLAALALHAEPRLSKLAYRLLSELNIHNSLHSFAQFTGPQRLRLGTILLQVDSTTLDVVRDGLRHAVMRHRMAAIEFTQTLGLVDVMIEPFTAIARSDHQSARLAVAAALGTSTSDATANLLHELAASPLGSLRDVAQESLSRRGIEHVRAN